MRALAGGEGFSTHFLDPCPDNFLEATGSIQLHLLPPRSSRKSRRRISYPSRPRIVKADCGLALQVGFRCLGSAVALT
jgi:hypothetical protein